ncbi:hypothetical protein, partial [Peribacillus sp. YIM B13540]|uniref:hypothetical protein n=1 Tax=Peribacillus sp. YIM B13540 TaxID=3366296 RepID=UPI00366BD881
MIKFSIHICLNVFTRGPRSLPKPPFDELLEELSMNELLLSTEELLLSSDELLLSSDELLLSSDELLLSSDELLLS